MRTKSLKILLLLLIIGCTALVLIVFWRNQDQTAIDADKPEMSEDEGVAIGKIEQTATRDGVKQWYLEADSGTFSDARKQAHFVGVRVTFFLKNNREVWLTADRGMVETGSNNIEVSGHVVVQNEFYRLETEQLNYNQQKRIITTKNPVRIIAEQFELQGGTMHVDLDSDRATLTGSVEGLFNETFRRQINPS